MNIAQKLLPKLYKVRGKIGKMGFRVHAVELVTELFDSGADGSAFAGSSRLPIVEDSGQPPKVVWKKADDVAFGNAMENIVEIGPITPAFAGGGTDLTSLMGSLARGEVRYLFITGPKVPDGVRYRILDVKADKALRYMITAQGEGEALKGL
jgi:hypothetical protein